MGDQAVRVSIALGVIDAFAVALRLLARWRSNAAFAADDALIIASLVPLFAMIVLGNLCWSTPLHSSVCFVDLNRCQGGRFRTVDSGKSRTRTWRVPNLNAIETHDVSHRNGKTKVSIPSVLSR